MSKEVIQQPLSAAELQKRADESGFVSGIVSVSLGEIIEANHEGFLDLLSQRLTGTEILADISYSVEGLAAHDSLLIAVTGDVNAIIETE